MIDNGLTLTREEEEKLEKIRNSHIKDTFYRVDNSWVGRVIGKLTITGAPMVRTGGEYVAKCECGNVIKVTYPQIYYQTVYSCGCTPRPRGGACFTDYSGRAIGRLVVVQWVRGKGWECVCNCCGETEYYYTHNLFKEEGRECARPPRDENWKPKPGSKEWKEAREKAKDKVRVKGQ